MPWDNCRWSSGRETRAQGLGDERRGHQADHHPVDVDHLHHDDGRGDRDCVSAAMPIAGASTNGMSGRCACSAWNG